MCRSIKTPKEAFVDYLKEEGPRERLMQYGTSTLSDVELLALILRTGYKEKNVLNFSFELIKQFNGLGFLLSASKEELLAVKGLGKTKVSQILAVQELSKRLLVHELKEAPLLNGSHKMRLFCANQLGHKKIEHCIMILLDHQYRFIYSEEVARGTISEVVIYHRELTEKALKYSASYVVLSHNHPSGSLVPSAQDKQMTFKLKNALALFDIGLLDHIIVSPKGTVSMAEMGLV